MNTFVRTPLRARPSARLALGVTTALLIAVPACASATTSITMPVAAASVRSRSLANVVRRGLVVSYSVNEQVAGHFEVLVSAALAHRLKIGGALARGLPAGTPPKLVIARALLMTTEGGHSTIHIPFSRSTAKRLARSARTPLTLRLVVHDAAVVDPATTSVLTSVTLYG